MFIQVIQGRAADAGGMRRHGDRWVRELAGGATGWLGSTGGVAADGTAIMLVRFESEQAPPPPTERPEQGDWWNEMVKYYEVEPQFRDYSDVDTTLAGGSDDAGFVQVMQGRAPDRAKLEALEEGLLPRLQELRPDVIGTMRGWDGDEFVEAIYFTSEADARRGEAALAESLAGEFEEMTSLMEDVRYIDLTDPWLLSP